MIAWYINIHAIKDQGQVADKHVFTYKIDFLKLTAVEAWVTGFYSAFSGTLSITKARVHSHISQLIQNNSSDGQQI